MYKVVFHIEETKKASFGLKNIENLLIDLGADNVEVELLTNAEAVTMLAANNNENASRIADLSRQGGQVRRLRQCHESLQTYQGRDAAPGYCSTLRRR